MNVVAVCCIPAVFFVHTDRHPGPDGLGQGRHLCTPLAVRLPFCFSTLLYIYLLSIYKVSELFSEGIVRHLLACTCLLYSSTRIYYWSEPNEPGRVWSDTSSLHLSTLPVDRRWSIKLSLAWQRQKENIVIYLLSYRPVISSVLSTFTNFILSLRQLCSQTDSGCIGLYPPFVAFEKEGFGRANKVFDYTLLLSCLSGYASRNVRYSRHVLHDARTAKLPHIKLATHTYMYMVYVYIRCQCMWMKGQWIMNEQLACGWKTVESRK